jgi:hypothetical protein
LRDPAGIWREVSNVTASGSSEQAAGSDVCHVFPWARPANAYNGTTFDTNLGGMDAFDVDSDGDYILFDALINRSPGSPGDNGGRYLWLDGVAAVPGVSLAAEDVITVGSDTWHAFSNAFRGDVHDYVVLKEE